MMTSTLSAAAEAMQGTLVGQDRTFRGVSTDSRQLKEGELFFALQGPNFDGSRFVQQVAQKQGAGAVVASVVTTDVATILVDDPLQALGRLAASWRDQMPATVICITGSNGKTTLKELLASCLSVTNATLATHGNLNNEIGLPLMLLRMQKEHRFAVIEMGANHSGEIAYLTSLASPQVVAITNAGPAHLEGFGSLEGVARAKGEILCHERRPEFAALNADDDYFNFWRSLAHDISVVSFGLTAEAEVRASGIQATPNGSHFTLHMPDTHFSVNLALAGKHNVLNACAAAAIAGRLGIDADSVRLGLETVRPVGGRLQPVTSVSGAMLYDDTYNANPVSVQAAAEFLAAQEGKSCFVLGDMAELGGDAPLLHAHTGWVIREAGVDRLLATGPLSQKAVEAFGEGGKWFPSVAELAAELATSLSADDVVLVKGSRSSSMERVVDALTSRSDKARSA